MAKSFAHLVGLGRRSVAAKAEETEDERKEREDEEQAARDEECAKKEAAGEDTGETEDEKDERHDREESRRRAKKAAAEEDEDEDGDDDGDKEEMRGHGTIARARRRERGRIAAILAAPQAAANLPLAVELACNSAMSRDEAVRVLARTPAPRLDRSARNPRIGAGPVPGRGSHQDIQGMWGEAFARAVPTMRHSQVRR